MQQQIFTKDFIFERIKDTGYPFWSLGLWQAFKNVVNVMQYYGNDFEENDSDETKIEKSIKRLSNTISTFPLRSVFVIEIKNAKSANGSGILGPFQFSNSDTPPEAENNNMVAPGLGQIPAGYVPESMLKGVEDRINAEFNAKLEKYKAESERREREAEFRRREENLTEREKEIKELEKAYNSSVAKTADIFIEIGKKIAAYFFNNTTADNAIINSTPQTQLGQPQSVDEKEKVINDFAAYLYQNFDTQSIQNLKENLIQVQNESKLERPSNAANNDNNNESQL